VGQSESALEAFWPDMPGAPRVLAARARSQ